MKGDRRKGLGQGKERDKQRYVKILEIDYLFWTLIRYSFKLCFSRILKASM